MGAKTWMLVASDGHASDVLRMALELNVEATHSLVRTLFPSEALVPVGDADLTYTCPPDNEIVAGCFSGVSIVAAKEFAGDYPSNLPEHFLNTLGQRELVLHAMPSVVDWLAFAVWKNGALVRSLSLSPDSGVLEDIGPKLEFEKPFWEGKYPAVEPGHEDVTPSHSIR